MLAVKRFKPLAPVGGEVALITDLRQNAGGDLLVDGIVLAQKNAQREPLGERLVGLWRRRARRLFSG